MRTRTVSAIIFASVTLAGLTGCAAGDTAPTESTPPDLRAVQPVLEITEAADDCAIEIDSVVFLDAMIDGVSMGDGFSKHFDPALFNATIVDGEWHFEFLPKSENIAATTCHTDGDTIVSMTRAEFEQAMKGYTYDTYVEVATTPAT